MKMNWSSSYIRTTSGRDEEQQGVEVYEGNVSEFNEMPFHGGHINIH